MITEANITQIITAVGIDQETPIILEGPPVYLWPNQGFPHQCQDHPSVVSGWQVIDGLAARINPTKI